MTNLILHRAPGSESRAIVLPPPRVPDAPVSPKGGRPAMDKRQALRGIFWILDNGAKWKDLPRKFGSKSSVHKYFTLWTRGVCG